MKLSDNSIAHIAKILQVALITGTDIVDNLRMIRFDVKDEELVLEKEYQENHDASLQEMMKASQEKQDL